MWHEIHGSYACDTDSKNSIVAISPFKRYVLVELKPTPDNKKKMEKQLSFFSCVDFVRKKMCV